MTRTLWDALCGIDDRRGRKGRQYKLQSLLGISIAAMLAGANDLIAIFRWGRRLKPEALRLFGIEDGVAPCHATFHYFFKSLDADAEPEAITRAASCCSLVSTAAGVAAGAKPRQARVGDDRRFGANRAPGADLVFDDDGLPERLGQRHRQRAPHDVGRAARRERNHERQGLAGPGLRLSGGGHRDRQCHGARRQGRRPRHGARNPSQRQNAPQKNPRSARA